MKIKSLKILITLFIVSLMLAMPVCNAASDYILDSDGKTHSPIPKTHQISGFVNELGEEAGNLSEPADLYIASDDSIYIADTGNNRIVKLDADGNYVRSYTCDGKLSGPKGIYVADDGDLYISDTMNERIVHLNPKGDFVEEFVKPDSELLDENADFQIGRIGINSQGYLYTIQGKNFLAIDAENEFQGYVSSSSVGFSLKSLLIRMFASAEQKQKLLKEEPPSYNSFDIGENGLLYATLDETVTSGQIHVINVVQQNTYPNNKYGEVILNRHTGVYNNPRFVDIAVDKDGLIYVLEQYSCRIFIYDAEGQMLAAFGGKGNVKGLFSTPNALDINSKGEVFVLDEQTGFIHRFERTAFFKETTQAVKSYANGDYEASYNTWKKVLERDVNYSAANLGIARCLYKFNKYDEAMSYFRLADGLSGYGNAFSEYRHTLFRTYFVWVVLIIVVLVAIVLIVIFKLRKRADKDVSEYFLSRGTKKLKIPTHALLMIFHPLDNIDIIKRDKKRTLWAVPLFTLLAVVVNYTYIFYAHYSLNSKSPADANILLELAMVLVPFFSWILCAYLISAISSGESTFKELMVASSYAFVPYIILKPIIGIFSNVLSYGEIGLYNLLTLVALGWTLILLFTVFKRLNDYGFFKAVGVTLLSILMIVIMWAVILLLMSLTIQTVSFVVGIIEETQMKFF